ncbi:MAG: hypothetical protein ONB16_02215 [candidate division KSB1 bacterium]|nr:hypothetical protein [candidate division KSB1 bacterium]MDZ7341701.1 hypothetical protein [candidate division KSB1 bacterium]
MERFLKFKDNVTLDDLIRSQSDNRIIILRKSQATDTIQIKAPDEMSAREIKHAFGALQVLKVYDEFPYPDNHEPLSKVLLLPLLRWLQKITWKKSHLN